MRLNRLEKALMNNPIRAAVQRYFETRRLLAMGGQMVGGMALEIGCGRGVGTQLVLDSFRAEQVHSFDLDPRMVELARHRLSEQAERVHLWVGDVTTMAVRDAGYDAVFDFGILHHVPNWRDGLREVFRVLKPGGRFYAEEALRKLLFHPLLKRLFEHPLEDRFDHQQFITALGDCGFQMVAASHLRQRFGWYVARKPHDR